MCTVLCTLASASKKVWMLRAILPVYNHGFLQSEMRDAIFCLQPRFYVLQRGRLACTHLLFSLRLHLTVSLAACLFTGRQFVQKQAPCPPPQTQRWRNWTLSTLSSYNSTLNVSTDRRAGRQLSQRLTPPLHFHFHPHTLIYTRSWFLISRGGSSLPHSLFLQIEHAYIYIYIVVLQINLYLWCNHIHRWHLEVWIKNVCTQSRMDEVCVRIPVWPACLCFQTTTWRWKMCWGNSMQMAVWPGTGMERWGDRVSCCSQSNPSLQN